MRTQARAAIAEVTNRALEGELDRDRSTLGFGWARARRRALDARIEAPPAEAPAAQLRAA